MRTAVTVALVAFSLVLGGCGVRPESAPRPVELPPSATTPTTPRQLGPERIMVFFIDGDRLRGFRRAVEERTLADALDALVGGPSAREALAQVRTAVAPQSFDVQESEVSGDIAVVAASRHLTSVAGPDQLFAVGQVVWTVTEVPGVHSVRITVDGRPIEVPTDDGLTRQPVSRDDYMSVAPTRSLVAVG